MTLRVLSVGALTMDVVHRLPSLPTAPGKYLSEQALTVTAGMATSAAVAVVKLGGEADLWASVGDDFIGRELVASVARYGVGTSLIRQVRGVQSATSAILVGADGERIIVPRYETRLMSAPEAVPDLYAYGAVMVDVRWPSAALLALTEARRLGRPSILDADVGRLDDLRRLAGAASHIVASQPAAQALTGLVDPAAAVAELWRTYGGFIAITAGGNGCFWSHEGGVVRHVPAFQVEVVDTTAAGDVFHGAFGLAVAEGRSAEEALTFASAAAALKCTRFGSIAGAPTAAEVEAFMRSAE